MSALVLAKSPKTYDRAEQDRLRAALQANDEQVLKRRQDIYLVNGERVFQSYAANLTAHAGGGQASALQLAARINHLSTVATSADSVALPAALAGLACTVINRGANAAQVFGNGSDTINGEGATVGVAQAAGVTTTYYCPAAGEWFA